MNQDYDDEEEDLTSVLEDLMKKNKLLEEKNKDTSTFIQNERELKPGSLTELDILNSVKNKNTAVDYDEDDNAEINKPSCEEIISSLETIGCADYRVKKIRLKGFLVHCKDIPTNIACAYLKGHLTVRARDWYEVLGYALVQGEETDYDQLKQALKESFLVVLNKTEFEARFFASYQTGNQASVDIVYVLLKLQKAFKLEMTDMRLIQHSVSRFEPQVQDYVEVRNPTTERRDWRRRSSDDPRNRNWWNAEVLNRQSDRRDSYRNTYGNRPQRNHGFENRNRFDRDNRGFVSSNGRYQFRNRGPSDHFNRGDPRHGGCLNSVKFDRGRIVSYQDCGLSFWKIGSRVRRTTVMWICNHWMEEGTTDQHGRSHPPQCTTSREDRQIGLMAVTDRSVTSRTVAQHIESVTHHSVSARAIRRRLQKSGLSTRRPLLGLPLTQNYRRLRR
ncbi:transposable element Tcb1 transposase [Trichonephila clavipes]|nr:transposable element Tcb1 transposase [Trichonephila clavipes]